MKKSRNVGEPEQTELRPSEQEQVQQQQAEQDELEEQQKAQRKMLAAQRRRERHQRVRARLRKSREIEAAQEELRKPSRLDDTPTPAQLAVWRQRREELQKMERKEKCRARRRVRINNTIALLLDAVRDHRGGKDNESEVERYGADVLRYGSNYLSGISTSSSSSVGDCKALDEASRIKEITRMLNDRAYMCAQRSRGLEPGSVGLKEDGEGCGDHPPPEEREKGAASVKSSDIVSAKKAVIEAQDGGDDAGDDASSLFTTDDETEDGHDDDYWSESDPDSDDDLELAKDIDEGLTHWLSGVICLNDFEKGKLNSAREIMRGWIEIIERSRSAEIKNLRKCGSAMSTLDRECAKEDIRRYDGFLYGGSGRDWTAQFNNSDISSNNRASSSGRVRPQGSRAGAATTGPPAERLSDFLRGFRFYDVDNREHACGTSFPGTASHPYLSSRTERTRSCLQSQHQQPARAPDQTLVDPNLWEKFYGITDTWAVVNGTSSGLLRNDCDYAKQNMKKWAERFGEDRDQRACSFNASCNDDGGFFGRKEDMPDAPPLSDYDDYGYDDDDQGQGAGAAARAAEETFGTKGFKKPAWEFNRMPAPLQSPSRPHMRSSFAGPTPSSVWEEVKKKNVTFTEDLTSGNPNGGLFTPKENPQQLPQSPAQPSPKPKPKSRGSVTDYMKSDLWASLTADMPRQRPVPFDGNPYGGVVVTDPYRRPITSNVASKPLWDETDESFELLVPPGENRPHRKVKFFENAQHKADYDDMNRIAREHIAKRHQALNAGEPEPEWPWGTDPEQFQRLLETERAKWRAQEQAEGLSSAAGNNVTTTATTAGASPTAKSPTSSSYPQPSTSSSSQAGSNKRASVSGPGSKSHGPSRAYYNAFLGGKPATTENASLAGAAFDAARKRSFEQQQQGMMTTNPSTNPGGLRVQQGKDFVPFTHPSPASPTTTTQQQRRAAAALNQSFATGAIPGLSPQTAQPTRQQQQAQHQDAARAVNESFQRGPIPGISPPAASARRQSKNPYLRGGGRDNSSGSSDSDGGAPLFEGAAAAVAYMSSVAVEKARHAILHAGLPMKMGQNKDGNSSEAKKDTNQPSSSGQYV
ncbi:hypothetical protein PG994_008824 [Apiospora phragmitis]|uniref:Uncharacterized protein n=1 Tax=Apiospora phragmitis TaxID=2905665 RepID=A0ABR1UHJ5_9PEZI